MARGGWNPSEVEQLIGIATFTDSQPYNGMWGDSKTGKENDLLPTFGNGP